MVGVLDVMGSTNLYLAKAFEQLGYEVTPCNYRTINDVFGGATLHHVILRLAQEEPAMMLFAKCNGVDPNIIARCSLYTKTWYWYMDGMVMAEAAPEILDHASVADHVSCSALGVAKQFNRRLGITVHYIMEGVDPETYKPTVSLPDYYTDVSFIGTSNPERASYLGALADAGIQVKAYGNGFGGEVHGTQFNLVCSSSLGMLAISNDHGVAGEFYSDRLLRYGACRSFVLHKYTPGMDKEFIDGQDLAYFDSPDTLVDVVKFYFAPEREALRRQIAENLRMKVVSNYTWLHVAHKIKELAGI